MRFNNDYIMRQVESLVHFVSMLLFGRATPIYEQQDEQNPARGDLLHDALIQLLEQRKINEAENLLFENLEYGVDGAPHIALDFYHRLSALSEEQLAAAGFSRGEIDSGLRDALRITGMATLLNEYDKRNAYESE